MRASASNPRKKTLRFSRVFGYTVMVRFGCGDQAMRTTLLRVLALGVTIIGSGSMSWAADSHRHDARSVVYGPCGLYHFQIVEIDHYRVRRTALAPAHYCGCWWNGNPTDRGPSVSGNINSGQLNVR